MRITVFSLLGLLGLAVTVARAVDLDALDPFLEKHCYECHDDAITKGGLDFYAVPTDLNDEAALTKWVQVFDRVDSGEMPPEKRPRPEESDRAAFLDHLVAALTEAHEGRKQTVLRRLNRREYENTLNDLFGTNLDLARRIPEDGLSHGFDNVGESLSLSMVHLERYAETMKTVLDTSIAKRTAPPERTVISVRHAESKGEARHYENTWLKRPDGATVFFKATGYPDGSVREASPKISGRYRVRVTGYAFQTEEPVTFVLQARTYKRGADQPILGYFSVPSGRATTVETEAWIEKGYRLAVQPAGLFPDYTAFRAEGPKQWKGPGLAIREIELEGPLIEGFPSRGHRLMFDGLDRREIEPGNPNDRTRSWYRPKFEIVSGNPRQEVSAVLKRIATRAFRRPVSAEKIVPYLDLFLSERDGGADFEDALRTAVIAIFCSPDFLYLREKEGALDDWELASRLSYFLSRTLPDDELIAAAESGLLGDGDALAAQADRLLAGPRFERFLVDFTDSWLDLRNIEFTAPDSHLFPEFDTYLQWSMLDETRSYLRELIEKNLPVRNLVKSEFAMLNERLAEHYGIEGVDGPEIRRVSLPDRSVRGGFLSQGSVLKVSANGTNTSPVLRGVWVLERIFGKTPPPPPPAVPGVEPDIRGAETLRQLLDKHRRMESCIGCHEMIDPPGFALESFNPIGGWREQYRSLNVKDPKPETEVKGRRVNYRLGKPVDASGKCDDYGPFAGYREFRDRLAADEARLTQTLVTKLLVFATGREMGFSDRPEIDRIVEEVVAGRQGIRDLFHAVVASEIFRHK